MCHYLNKDAHRNIDGGGINIFPRIDIIDIHPRKAAPPRRNQKQLVGLERSYRSSIAEAVDRATYRQQV